jgi:hypothetical protein
VTTASSGYTVFANSLTGNTNPIAYMRVCHLSGTQAAVDTENIMLNSGSTAKPYEPWGFKIPISTLAGTAVNYLGSTQSTRQIKKLVLDGTESAYTYTYNNTNGVALRNMLETNYNHVDGLCTHYPVATSNVGDSLWIGAGNANLYFVGILDIMGYTTHNQFMQYLAGQYAAGTPVTVWYVLAAPTTGIVNEPLMKIGDYSDSISGISIPTTDGANTITVDTTVQPSEFTATWTGWHDASVKEYTGGAGTNLYDGTVSETDKRIATSSGGTYGASGYSVSKYIEIEPNVNYNVNTSYYSYYALYDSSKGYLYGNQAKEGIPITNTYSNAKYIRFDFKTADISDIELYVVPHWS